MINSNDYGKHKSKRLYQVAEIQLTYKSNVKPSLRPKVTSSQDNILRVNWDGSKIEFVEQFKVMLLNRANKVLGILDVSNRRSQRYSS